jgi:PHP family Zn ribbon phosphoesterase
MKYPVGPEDVKIVQGHSGKGLQAVCACGCTNWNHLEMSDLVWRCRNCGRILSYHFPRLVAETLALQKPETPAEAPAPKA